ncbi:unnamed protein product [Amoebophrya sp. A120]|nr:unnamed protein product [Amoebophrya sp. A120]|eukprot:GSA120T00008452001.1
MKADDEINGAAGSCYKRTTTQSTTATLPGGIDEEGRSFSWSSSDLSPSRPLTGGFSPSLSSARQGLEHNRGSTAVGEIGVVKGNDQNQPSGGRALVLSPPRTRGAPQLPGSSTSRRRTSTHRDYVLLLPDDHALLRSTRNGSALILNDRQLLQQEQNDLLVQNVVTAEAGPAPPVEVSTAVIVVTIMLLSLLLSVCVGVLFFCRKACIFRSAGRSRGSGGAQKVKGIRNDHVENKASTSRIFKSSVMMKEEDQKNINVVNKNRRTTTSITTSMRRSGATAGAALSRRFSKPLLLAPADAPPPKRSVVNLVRDDRKTTCDADAAACSPCSPALEEIQTEDEGEYLPRALTFGALGRRTHNDSDVV